MNTRKIIHKVYLAWDFKKEELWLNEMAAEGWALEHAAFCSYTFVRCEPGEYIIRMEMNADRDYRSFVEETGAEIVNLLCSVLLAYGLGRIHGMNASLEEERALHE